MFREIGRLDAFENKRVEDYLQEVFDMLDEGKTEKAIEMLAELSKTNNYFLREQVGKLLIRYSDQERMKQIASDMLESKVYGIRATALFYFFNININSHADLMKLLEENYESVPWEVESMIYELWKKSPKITKEMIPLWIQSEDEKKRMISFHGMELIVEHDSTFVLDFLSKAVDDPSMEVQKKITHIILQIVKVKPAETYAYIREWIMTGSDKRVKCLLMTMKKILSLYSQKSQKDKTPDFMTLTKHIINDWKSEPNKKISNFAHKMQQALRSENDN